MQIVIELSDETYKDIKEENGIYGINNGLSARITGKVVGAIQSGTPLPKGHGRLIDEKDLSLMTIQSGTPLPKGHGRLIDEKDLSLMTIHLIDGILICDAPTIIEADKTKCEEV